MSRDPVPASPEFLRLRVSPGDRSGGRPGVDPVAVPGDVVVSLDAEGSYAGFKDVCGSTCPGNF